MRTCRRNKNNQIRKNLYSEHLLNSVTTSAQCVRRNSLKLVT
ncbi:Uncharacterised protein r2_g3574 [Pycnogonum litorale]